MADHWIVAKLQGDDGEFYEIGRRRKSGMPTDSGMWVKFPEGMSPDDDKMWLMHIDLEDDDGNILRSIELLDPLRHDGRGGSTLGGVIAPE
ncbi:hypothetical protein [Cryptosporangium minutisporangium]|uniref:Uncharacterized protein n=1 Tax=Cryptosporangium minutisporangium TaxID=113569 RepID=A0ABP6TCT0_9ACTN